jgi:hypothetical protein
MRQSEHENPRDDELKTPTKSLPQGPSRFRHRDYAEEREHYPDESDRR